MDDKILQIVPVAPGWRYVKGVFLALPVVLIMATTSAAECAWVFWIKNETTFLYKDKPYESTTRWEMEKAFDTHAQCDQVKERVWEVKASHYDDLTKLPGVESVEKVPYEAVFVSWKEGKDILGGGHTMYFQCYPDTIDPRGK